VRYTHFLGAGQMYGVVRPKPVSRHD
jgi:hypothetical protein